MNNQKQSESSIAQIKSKIKVVFLGDQSTGKTSILLRYMHDKFEDGQAATVGIDFMAKNININTTNLRLQLWDTAGQERFRSLIPSYLKDATVIFIVFDITNKRSFQNTREWLQLSNQNKKQKSIIVLVGNKSDLQQERQVSIQQIQKFANQQQLKYFEVSAKLNHNIAKIFYYAGEQYIEQTFGNEVTIGNIQNIHSNLMKKMKQNSKQPIQLKQNPILNQQNKKQGCC